MLVVLRIQLCVPVHNVITVFLESQNNTGNATRTYKNLQHILGLILERVPIARVFISGEFNM